MGRTPALEGFSSPTPDDEAAACAAIDRLGLSALADRDCTTLSGGELRMVLVARAWRRSRRSSSWTSRARTLTWAIRVIVLDRIRELVAEDLAVVVTSHDPNHAFLLDCDVVCVGRGERMVCGPHAKS